jgi:hypothetical protein
VLSGWLVLMVRRCLVDGIGFDGVIVVIATPQLMLGDVVEATINRDGIVVPYMASIFKYLQLVV